MCCICRTEEQQVLQHSHGTAVAVWAEESLVLLPAGEVQPPVRLASGEVGVTAGSSVKFRLSMSIPR